MAIAAAVMMLVGKIGARPAAAWAWGTGCGFVAAQLGLEADSGWGHAAQSLIRPTEAVEWLSIIVLLALGVSLLLIAVPLAYRRYAWVVVFLFTVAAAMRLLAGNERVRLMPGGMQVICLLALVAVLIFFWWLLSARGSGTPSQVARVVLVIVVAVGAAAVLTLSGVLVYGQLCGAVAAALTGCGVARLVAPAAVDGPYSLAGFRGAAGVIVLSLVGLIVLAHFFAELSASNAALLLVSLAAGGGPVPTGLSRQPPWVGVSLRTALCLAPLSAAVVSVAT